MILDVVIKKTYDMNKKKNYISKNKRILLELSKKEKSDKKNVKKWEQLKSSE